MNKELAQEIVATGYVELVSNFCKHYPTATEDEFVSYSDNLFKCQSELLRLIKGEEEKEN